MQRRIALSFSLAITTIVMFAMVTVGAQAGFFSEHKAAKAAQVAASAQPAAALPASGDEAAASAEEDPLVVTDYVYIDEAGAPVIVRQPRAASRPGTSAPAALTAASKARPQSQPAAASQPAEQPPAAAPPAAAIPTQAAPESTATQPSASTATKLPAATSTPKPAATAPSAPAQPTAPPASSQPTEIEFIGTVTAVNGNMVTFLHGGVSTAVRVTQQFAIGAQVHVHAFLSGGVYVAVQVEAGD